MVRAPNAYVNELRQAASLGISLTELRRRRAEHARQMAVETWRYPDGSIKNITRPHYPASCNSCGWQGSSEKCGLDTGGDDSDVYCPVCGHPGCDHGVAAEKAVLVLVARP